MTTTQLHRYRPVEGFRHEALLYAGDQEFLAGTSAFIRDGLSADEAILVVVSAAKIAALLEHRSQFVTTMAIDDADSGEQLQAFRDRVFDRMRANGEAASVTFAEAFTHVGDL